MSKFNNLIHFENGSLKIFYFFKFSCVPFSQCDSQFDASDNDYDLGIFGPKCDDDDKTCCHESNINFCQNHKDIGYR